MLIAYSCPDKRYDLEEALTSRRTRSYAKSTDLVLLFIDSVQELRPEKWFLRVLSCCRRMLHVDRDQRPLIDELDSAWSSMEPSDHPLTPCKCREVVPATQDDEIIELCKKGSLTKLEALLANRADANIIGAIHHASARGFTEIVQLLLHHNVNVNLQDYSEQTALHCAAGYGNKSIVEMLLKKEANVRLKDDQGQTALHCAASQGHQSVAEMLIRNGSDVQAVDSEGCTALHFAARRGHDEVVRLLLDQQADARLECYKGCTALHFAAGFGAEKVVERLLRLLSKPSIDIQDEKGRTALHFAARESMPKGIMKESEDC